MEKRVVNGNQVHSLITLQFECNKAFAESCYFRMLPREEHSCSSLNQDR